MCIVSKAWKHYDLGFSQASLGVTNDPISTSRNPNIEAIIWDFGGVFTSSPFEAFNVLEAEIGAPKDFIRGINAVNPETNAWAQFESNSVSMDDFDELFAAESAGQRATEFLAKRLSQG